MLDGLTWQMGKGEVVGRLGNRRACLCSLPLSVPERAERVEGECGVVDLVAVVVRGDAPQQLGPVWLFSVNQCVTE